MRTITTVISASVLIAQLSLSAANGPLPQALASVVTLLERARDACGGSARLRAVTSLRLSGKSENRNLFYGQTPTAKEEFIHYATEQSLLLPDHYLLIERRTDGAVERFSGFAGSTPIYRTVINGQVGTWSGPEAMAGEQAQFARLMILLLLRTDSALALTPKAESSSKIRFTGADGFDATVDIAADTGRPISLAHTVRIHGSDEVRTYVTRVDERRTVDGVSLPVRMTTTALGKIFSKVTYDTIEINPRLTPADFTKVAK
jgi:hypothetical protein